MALSLSNPDQFGRDFLSHFDRDGWGSLSKRDLELLLFVLLEKDGALPRQCSNYDIARRLRVTESKVSSLRRDSYARWRPLIGEEETGVVKRILLSALDEAHLERAMRFFGQKMSEGNIPLLIEHPDDRAEFEHAVKAVGGIPVFERNREVLLVHYLIVLQIAEGLGLLESDPKRIRSELEKLLGERESLSSFFQKPISKLTLSGARSALNDAGGIIVEGTLKGLLPSFLKLAIPSIP